MNGLKHFAKENHNLYKSQNRLFCFVMSFCVFVLFQYFNFAYNPLIKISAGALKFGDIDLSSAVMSGISLCIVIIMMLVMGVLCQSFFKQKTLEVAVLSLSGVDVSKISHYLFTQLWFVLLKAIPIGFIIFLVINPVFNLIVQFSLSLQFNLFLVSLEAMVLSLISIAVMVVALLLNAYGFTYRSNLISLLETLDQSNRTLPISHLKMPSIAYWIIFIMPLFALGGVAGNSRGIIVFVIVALYGLLKVLKKSLAKVLLKIRMLFLQTKKEDSIAVGRTMLMLNLLSNNIGMHFLSVLILITFMSNNYDNPELRLLLYFTYFIILLLVTFTTIYRNLEDNQKVKKQYETIYHLGFSIKQMKSIALKELILTFIINITFTLVYGMTIVILNQGIMPLLNGIMLLVLSVLSVGIALIVVYFDRQKLINQLTNGGVGHGC